MSDLESKSWTIKLKVSDKFFRISPKEMALAFFDELEGGIISIIDVVAKFGKNPDLSLG